MDNFLLELLKTGNIYIIVVAILLLILYLFIKFFFCDYNKTKIKNKINIESIKDKISDESTKIEKTVTDNDRVFYKNIKQIIVTLDRISGEIEKLNLDNKERIKEIEHRQEKITDKVLDSFKTLTEIKDEVINLKYKVELMVVQRDNSTRLNKGL